MMDSKAISNRYNPKEIEDKWYKEWEEKGYFAAEAKKNKKPFCIVIPPPNVTGILHMGHALNNTYQDVLIRFKRMQGYESLWMPGTDHAGIATQNVVERQIAKENLNRKDLGREEFLNRVWKWKEQRGSTIIKQLKKLGASCDWQRTRFTMDDKYSDSVKEVFIKLHEKGLIYRGKYMVNWCPRCQTALSDEESAHKEIQGKLYYIKYPLKDEKGQFITVATTRPETMLGDTAVAVNPKDSRFKKYIGKILVLPLMKREINVIAEPSVDPEFGTGCVKVTPAHDPNDYAMGKKHGLEFINILNPDGTLNQNAGKFQSMERTEGRKAVLKALEKDGLLIKDEIHSHAVGHCYRCHTVVEPYLYKKQWFVKMKPLAKPAIDVVKKNKIKFYPERWKRVYLNWMDNIQDWCISRQIWWGHRIPAWYCKNCLKQEQDNIEEVSEGSFIVAKNRPEKCDICGGKDFIQDEDVLDTWFSSWLWPFATFNWPERNQDLKYFYPTSVLVTAPEIIFFWVARMIMAGLEFMKEIPFEDVYIHGTVRDETGTKMSKSLGNIIDPLEVIEQYGTDALRFSLVSITSVGQDVFLSKEKFELGRNFANKIWNASRFVLMNLDEAKVEKDLKLAFSKQDLRIADKWIVTEFYLMLKDFHNSFEQYRFNEAANLLHEFFWNNFCDWYLEISKNNIDCPSTQSVLYHVLEQFLRLLHPFMPFITEELWSRLPFTQGTLMLSPMPEFNKAFTDLNVRKNILEVFGVISSIRNIKADLGLHQNKDLEALVLNPSNNLSSILQKFKSEIIKLSAISDLTISNIAKRPKHSAISVLSSCEICIPLEGVVDFQAQVKKIDEKFTKVQKELEMRKKKLQNENFIVKAPEAVVQKEKERCKGLEELLKKIKSVKDALK